MSTSSQPEPKSENFWWTFAKVLVIVVVAAFMISAFVNRFFDGGSPSRTEDIQQEINDAAVRSQEEKLRRHEEIIDRLDTLIVLKCRELDNAGADSLTQAEVEACS